MKIRDQPPRQAVLTGGVVVGAMLGGVLITAPADAAPATVRLDGVVLSIRGDFTDVHQDPPAAQISGGAGNGTWRMDQRTVLFSGATSGVGRATAAAMVGVGSVVLAHARLCR